MLKANCFQHSAICFFIFYSLNTEFFKKMAETKKQKKLAFSIQKKPSKPSRRVSSYPFWIENSSELPSRSKTSTFSPLHFFSSHLPLRHRRLPDEKKKKRGRIRHSPEHRRRIGGGSNIQFRIQQKRRIEQQQ